MPKCPLPFYRVDDKPSRTVKVREGFLCSPFSRNDLFFSRCSGFFIQSGFFPFYSTIVSPSSPYLVFTTFSPVGFSHAKVQRSSGVKHRHANGSWICPAAFPNRRCPFSPLLVPRRVGYSVKFPGRLLAFPSFPPLSGLHVKSLPPRKAERLPRGGK